MFGLRQFVLLVLLSAAAYAAQPASKPQESLASYWTSEPGWETEFQLKNNLSSGSLTVTPILRLSSSEEIPLGPVTIGANDTASVSVNSSLLKGSPEHLSQPGSYGSVVFRFNAADARNLYAVSILQLQGTGIEFANEAHPVPDFATLPRTAGPGSQEGIWVRARPGDNDLLIVCNSSEKPLKAKLWLSDAVGTRRSHSVPLSAHQTQRVDLRELVFASQLRGDFGGIEVEVPSYSGGLHTTHILYNEQAQSARSLKMTFRDPATTLAERIPDRDHRPWTTWATMVPLQTPDPSLGLPAGTSLQPFVFLRNVTSKSVTASLSLTWHGETGKADGSAKLADFRLTPHETRRIPITADQTPGLPESASWATIKLTTAASPDDLVAFASSHDSTGRYGTDVSFTDAVGGHFAGGEWRADSTHDAIIAVTNAGSVPTVARLSLHYGKGEKKYEVQRALQPGQQIWVRLADIIQGQVPDRNGKPLAFGTSAGTFEVTDLAAKPGSLLVSSLNSDKGSGGRLRRQIPECCSMSNPQFVPSSFDVLINGLLDPFVNVAYDSCSGGQEPLGMIDFWSSIPSIAQITAQGVKGLAVGSTTGNGESEVVWVGIGSNCVLKNIYPKAPVTVFDVGAVGPPYIFVGTDPNEIRANEYQATNGAHTALPQPPGGTCCAASSDLSDLVTLTPTGNNPFTFHVETTDQSATAGDRKLTFEYDLSPGKATSVQLNVTARKFVFLTNNNPANACNLKYGTKRTYVYTAYTHPDGQAVVSSDGLVGTAVGETFSAPLACASIVGNGGLQLSGQISDDVGSGVLQRL